MSASPTRSGYCETPVSTPDCGEPVALSVKVMAPVRFGTAPIRALVNLTCTMHDPPGAKTPPAPAQPLVTIVKAQTCAGTRLAPAPVTATAVTVTVGPP